MMIHNIAMTLKGTLYSDSYGWHVVALIYLLVLLSTSNSIFVHLLERFVKTNANWRGTLDASGLLSYVQN